MMEAWKQEYPEAFNRPYDPAQGVCLAGWLEGGEDLDESFLIDVSICNGCYNCQIACKDEHCSNDWAPYAAPQPEIGQFWLKVHEHIRGTVPKVKMHYVPCSASTVTMLPA